MSPKLRMFDSREPTDPDEVRRFLDGSKGEREPVRYLQEYPDLASWAFCRTGGHSRFLLSEFPLGSQYKVDFVALVSYSGAWEVHYVELEPVDDKVFTKNGAYSAPLERLVRQDLSGGSDAPERDRSAATSVWVRRRAGVLAGGLSSCGSTGRPA